MKIVNFFLWPVRAAFRHVYKPLVKKLRIFFGRSDRIESFNEKAPKPSQRIQQRRQCCAETRFHNVGAQSIKEKLELKFTLQFALFLSCAASQDVLYYSSCYCAGQSRRDAKPLRPPRLHFQRQQNVNRIVQHGSDSIAQNGACAYSSPSNDLSA